MPGSTENTGNTVCFGFLRKFILGSECEKFFIFVPKAALLAVSVFFLMKASLKSR